MIDKIFLKHPRSVGENYFEHMAFAIAFSLRLFTAALACLIHAFIPALFESKASRIVKHLNNILQENR